MLNDRFGIQARGGCSCAGTYGHRLLQVNKTMSAKLRKAIHSGDLTVKPGWVRISIHPTMTNREIEAIVNAIEQVSLRYKDWMCDYTYDTLSNEYICHGTLSSDLTIENWFNCY